MASPPSLAASISTPHAATFFSREAKMSTFIHLNSTCLLDQALSPKYLPPPPPPNAPNHEGQAPPLQPMQIPYEVTEEIFRMHREMFPQWWPVPPPSFNQHVANVRDRVHRLCRPTNMNYLQEVHQFFLELRPAVMELMSNDGFWTSGRNRRREHNHESMGPNIRRQTRAQAQSQPQTTRQIFETEMDIDSDFGMETEGMAAGIMRQSLPAFRTVPAGRSSRWVKGQRRRIEGDCTICLSPLRRVNESQIRYKPPNSIGKGCRPGGVDHPRANGILETHCPCSDDEDLSEYEIVWCRAFCGTNYHFECMDEWMEYSLMGARVTCPTCRRPWQD
ncbi:hypothetical protein BDV06DRAFT_55711 [Aspergillus oleicola]